MLHRLHISSLVYRIAILTLLVPYSTIWYAAFYAFAKIREYSRTIKGYKDGSAFQCIMVGTGVLAFGLVSSTAVSLIAQNIAVHHPGLKPLSVIVSNYCALAVGIAAFICINHGTYQLAKLSKTWPGLTSLRLFALVFITLSVTFTYLVITYHMSHADTYYLSMPLLITTFIIPNIFGWFVAVLSAYEFRLYARFAKGLLYRKSLRLFSYGIMAAIAGSVVGQFVDNTFASKVSRSLGSLLLVEYILLAMFAAGLVLMALGAKKLKRIEEV